MGLSYDIISEFVKITNDNKEKPKEGTVYATVVSSSGGKYVKIDGSDLLTPMDTTADIEDGERVTLTIKDHKAIVTGNVTSPSASTSKVDKVSETVSSLSDRVGTFELVVADKISTKELEAYKATIEVLIAQKASIENLNATNAEIDKLKAKDAQIENLVADKATISDLQAVNATIENLKAKDVEIENAVIDNLEATTADIRILSSDFAQIKTLVNGNLTSDNILSFNITSEKVTMEDAFIKDAMIDTISAGKINAGKINTNAVSIGSEDGAMTINGSTQQFRDKDGNVRIQIGQDASGDFTFILYGEDGTGQLINQNGITASAIGSGLIVNDMVSDNAAIAGGKLDISSVITEINNDNSTTIKSNKIYLNEQEQSLEVAFNSLKTKVDTIQEVTIDGDLAAVTEQVQSNTTQIAINKESINSLVSEDTVLKKQVSDLNDNIISTEETLTAKYTTLEQNLEGFQTNVADTYATKTSVNDVNNNLSKNYSTTTTMNSAIAQKASEITASVASTYATKNEVKTLNDNLEANYSTTEQMESAIAVAKDGIDLSVSSIYETKTESTTKANNAKADAISAASTDATSKVNAAKTELNTAISKKANSADVYTKTETYTKAETDSKIKIAKDAIDLSVSTTYETKSNVESMVTSTLGSAKEYADTKKSEAINTAASDATAKANIAKQEAITSANNTLTSTISNYYTKSETDSQINITKDAINLGVSTLRSEVTRMNFNNLLWNSDFLVDNETGDFYKGYYRTSSEYTFKGDWVCPEGGKTILINTLNSDITWQGFTTPRIKINKDQTLTASVYVATENIDSIDPTLGIEIEWFGADGNRIATSGNQFKPSSNYIWERVLITGTAPEGAVTADIYCWNAGRGISWWGKPMLQFGSTCTAWDRGGDFDNINERLSSAELKITDDSIIATVSGVYETKTTVQNKIDNIQVGGTNLMTQDDNNLLNWDKFYPDRFEIANSDYDNTINFKTLDGGWEVIYKELKVVPNTNYTLSFDYAVLNEYIYFGDNKFGLEICSEKPEANHTSFDLGRYIIENTPTDLKRVSLKFTPKTAMIYLVINGGRIDDGQQNIRFNFNKFKLEKGTKATDWSPAPEDVKSDITSLESETSSIKQTVTSIQLGTDNINATVKSLSETLTTSNQNLAADIASVQNQVNMAMTSDEVKMEIKKELVNGVNKVTTSTGYVFDQNGLSISKSGSEMETKITEDGMKVFKNDEVMLTANNQGVDAKNLHATTYLIIGGNSRMEDFKHGTEKRTAVFWIG